MSLSESTKIEDICSNLEIKIRSLIITIQGRTKYSLIEGDLDNHQTGTDFGSVMKNLTCTGQNKTKTWFLKKSIGHAVCYL